MTLKIFTIEALAEELGMSYDYLKNILVKYHNGEIDEFKGYKFFGEPKKVWYAYPKDAELELVRKEKKIDAGPEQQPQPGEP